MNKQIAIKFLSTIILFSTLIYPSFGKSSLAQNTVPNPPGLSQTHELWVIRVYFTNHQQVEQIAAWTEPWEVNYKEGYLVIEVDSQQFNLLVAQGYRIEVDQKLTTLINRPFEYLPGQINGIPGYSCYRTVEETYSTAANIAIYYPNLAEWIDVGDSWEKTQPGGSAGYDLMVLKLTNELISTEKAKLFVMSAIHAREYTTAELVTRFAEYLIQNYDTNPDITWLLDSSEIYLLFQSNPDGRKQAETGLSWRKNTNENYCSPTSTSRGADLNRNFSFQWGCCGGSSGSQCDTTYRGPTPASEPEVQAVQNFLRATFPDQRGDLITDPAPDDAIGVFLDIHSYGGLVLWPWGFTSTTAPNANQLQTLGRKFAYFNGYEPEQAIGLYPTDGTTDDFAYGDLGLAAYTVELGTSFFQDCATFENTILPENMSALLYAAKVSRAPYIIPAGPDAINLTLTPNIVSDGDLVTLHATINDSRYNNINGTEPTQNIAAAVYYIDTLPWETGAISHTMNAVDGVFNFPIEDVTASINTSGMPTGRHTVYIHGQDANGNWGAVSAVFLYVIDSASAPIIQGYVREISTNLPLSATVTANDIFQTNADPATGFYQMHVLSGTYQIEATSDNHGAQIVTNVLAADNQTTNQDFSLAPICVTFSDDVESGNIGWVTQTPWAITSENSHSPTHSWTDSPGGDYGNGRNISLTSPIIDLTGFSDVHLDFWQNCDTEAGYDYCHVEISNNNGISWSEIGTFDGAHAQWENINLPASILDEQPDARLRFRFTSDAYITDDGWHIDDIEITGAGTGCIVDTPPTASFTSSSPDPLGTTTVFNNFSSGTNLGFEWELGDGTPIITETNPVHMYEAAGFYTVILTATNNLGTDVYSDVVQIFEPNGAQFTISKTASVTEISSGDIFTYTLSAELILTGTNAYSLSLIDRLPVESRVLTDSIRVDGSADPSIYLSETHSINYQGSGLFTETHPVAITFQVQVENDVTPGMVITNQLDGLAYINSQLIASPETAFVDTPIIASQDYKLYLPVFFK